MWIYLALLSPFLMSFTNLMEKFLIDKKIKNHFVVPLFGGIISFIIGVFVFIFHGFILLPLYQIAILVTSGIFLILYLIPYFKALAIDDSSRVVPLFQFVPLFVLILSRLLLNEQLTNSQMIAFVFILSGGILLGMERSDISFLKPRKSLLLMLLSSFIVSFVSVLFKFGYVTSDFFTTVAYQSIGSGIAVVNLLFISNIRKDFLKELKTFKQDVFYILLFNKGLEFFAELISFVAITLAPIALVSVFGGLQPFFVLVEVIILSLWFPHIIKEHISKGIIIEKVLSMLLFLIGIYFISL